ncbi:Abi family protein [Nitratifractor salsuginis]|uniref:Abi family protein n=1 Tax=Nitratifractor salsuginis (strain DSM 16511 / JCM 12458 / E9I37-1) TaxID=749222 RepID=E6WYW3_NITSE|nr:Abi family protein [Nitratifractor salsuginis]ADV46549.1 Abi family protein [Nitratifractor salsuginis DSM 16511]
MKLSYTKSPLTFSEQVHLLQERGLIVPNSAYAELKLAQINYYRLSAYMRFFQDDASHCFREGTTFEQVIRLYYFDKKLRNLIFYAMEKLEVYFRTTYAYHTAMEPTLGAFGYTKSAKMHDLEKHASILEAIRRDVDRSKEVFVTHFFSKYDGDYLPVWMMVEVISFSTLSRLYGNLRAPVQQKIADSVNLNAKVLAGWLHSLTYVRNLCAHHARTWNKLLAIRPMVPRGNPAFSGLNNRKIFFVLSMIRYLLEAIDGDEYDFRGELMRLLAAYPDVPLYNMGFPEDWKARTLWVESKEEKM